MPRLYSDLQDGSARRYYFGLTSAPGGISPATTTLQVQGLQPTIFVQTQVFRTPAPAVITVNGQQVVSDLLLRPAQATISLVGQIPGLQTTRVITNSLPPDYTDLPSNPPTILFINTITPTTGSIVLQGLLPNATPGGNIGFISPAVATVTIQGRTPVFVFFELGVGQVVVTGYAPVLHTTRVIEPEPGTVQAFGRSPRSDQGFVWIDVDPPPPTTWTPTTGVAA